MRLIKASLFLVLFLSASFRINAQIGGVFFVPGDFPTIAAAINTLNVMGVATGVTVNVAAGYTETAPAGGLRIYNVAGTSSSNPIVFRKNGSGANPLITANTGTASLTSNIQDGVWACIGTDYLTIDGIDLVDPNTSGNDMMEYGYGFYKLSATDGCQNNTIKNCVITLNHNNVTNSNFWMTPGGARGIDMIAASYTNNINSLAASSAAGTNSNNKFYGNYIQNCHVGIALSGQNASFMDSGSDVGGLSAVTGNTIINFGGGSNNSPTYGVYANQQLLSNISFNTITNNNGSGAMPLQTITGIHSGAANVSTGLSINSNTITLGYNGSISIGMSGIVNLCNAGSTQTISICKNVFPSFTYSSSAVGYIDVINHSVSSFLQGRVVLDSNLISNVNAGSGTFNMISLTNSSSGSGDCFIRSNSITNFSATSGALRVFDTQGTGDLYLSDNYAGNITFTGPGTYTITGVQTANPNGDTWIRSNTIENINVSAGMAGNFIKGIHMAGSLSDREVDLNVIRNINSDPLAAAGFSFTGIELTSGQYSEIKGNSIYNINSISTNTTGILTLHGILISSNPTSVYVERNKIAKFSCNGNAFIYLVRQSNSSSGSSYYNNILGDVQLPNSTQNDALVGFYIQSGRASLYYNSVFLSSTVTPGMELGSAAVALPISHTLTIQNNIFVNTSMTGTNTSAKIYRFSASTTNAFGPTSNNNLYFVGTPAPNRLIAEHTFLSTYSTLASFQATVAPRDNYAILENPPFLSTVGSSSNFLNIDPALPTQAEGTAIPYTGNLGIDYAGTQRHPVTPDRGAWEGNFMQADFYPPVVIQSGFSNAACNASGRTFTASIWDTSGVATGSLSPRLYFRKNFGLYSSVQGSLVAGTTTAGVWSFSMSYSALPADIISYYLAIQDQSPLVNKTIFPANGFVMVDVNTINTPPIPAQTYTVSSVALSGTYNVGAGQTYTSLTQAANAYNTSCLAGPVTFSLTDAMYSTNEIFPVTFQLNTDASATNSLLIIPAAGSSVTIVSSSTAAAVIKLLDAQYVNLNGNNQTNSALLLTNSNTATSTVVWLATGTGPMQGNRGVTLNALQLKGSTNTVSAYYGILSSANASAVTATLGAYNNDGITISNNSILRVGTGICAVGISSLVAGRPDNWLITGNTIGPVTSGTNNLCGSGIYIRSASHFSITANTVQNLSVTVSEVAGINLAQDVELSSISQNTISNLNSDTYQTAGNTLCGIYLGLDASHVNVFENVISKIHNTYIIGTTASGILCNTLDGGDNRIFNNMISVISSFGDNNLTALTAGIYVDGSTRKLDIDNNSVHLTGAFTGRASANTTLVSAALFIETSGNQIRLRNNILANSYDYTGKTDDKNYALYSLSSPSAFLAVDHNNYFVGTSSGTNVPVLAFSGSDLNSLATIQATLGGNASSTTLAPVFTSSVDLHLQSVSANQHLDDTGTPLGGITVDIDGQARSLTTPDIGADEFSSANCSLVNGGTVSPAAYSVCAGQTLALVSAGTSTDSGISFKWQIAATAGGTYTDVVQGSGFTLDSYTTQVLSPGVFYYRLKSTCSVNSATAATNEVTVSVFATPAITAAVSSGSLCAGNTFTLTSTAPGATAFNWTGPGSFSSGSQNPVIASASTAASGQYTVMAVAGTCSSVPATVSVSVLPVPTLSVTGSQMICSGETTTLTASGATTYSWSTGAGGTSISVSPATVTNYTVEGSFASGCSSLKTVTVIANPVPTINISAASTSVCSGSAVSFTPNGALSYTWSTGFAGTVLSVTPAVAAVYSVTGKNLFNCTASAAIAVGVYTLPLINVSASGPSVCAGNTVNISASGATGFTWSPGGSQTSAITVTPLATTVYSVLGVNAQNCFAKAQLTVTVADQPTITVSNGTICPGGSFTLTPSGAASYTFSGGSSVVSPVTNTSYSVTGSSAEGCISANPAVAHITLETPPTITVSSGTLCYGQSFTLAPAGAQTYTYSSGTAIVSPLTDTSYSITGTSAAGCVSTNTAVASLTVLTSPTVAVSGGSVCAGQSFTLQPSGALTYTYSGGSDVVTPLITGSYSVTGTNSLGCVSQNPAVATVSVSANPTVFVNSGTICEGASFTITPTGANSYNISGNSFTVNPLTNTSYTVAGTSAEGCVSEEVVASITVVVIPTIAVNSGSICAGRSFTIHPTGAQSYTIEGGNTVVSPLVTTSYTVTGANAPGCYATNTATSQVTVFNVAPVSITGPGSVCMNTTHTLSASGAFTYTWNTGGQGSTVVASPATSITYSVRGTDLNGCESPAVYTFTLNPGPSLAITGNSMICEGTQASLMATGTAINFTWSTGANGNLISVTPSVSTVYSVTGIDLGACASTATILVFVNSLPALTANASSTAVCLGNSVTLSGSGASTYTWSGGVSNNVSFYPTASAVYVLSGTGLTNCVATKTIAIQVNVLPVLTVTASADTICAGDEVSLTASGANSYVWSPAGGTAPLALVSPVVTTNYTVTGTDGNGCSSAKPVSVVVNDCEGVGVKNNLAELPVMIYPNPSQGEIFIQLPGISGTITVEVRNYLSQQVFSQVITEKEVRLDLRSVAKGVYFIQLTGPGNIQTVRKMIIE